MRYLPGRLRYIQKYRDIRLRKLAREHKLEVANFTHVLQGNRNTKKYISVLETTFGLPIQTLRQIYREDKNRKWKISEFNEWRASNANAN